MVTVPSYSCPSIAGLQALNGPGPTPKLPTDKNYGVRYLVLSYRNLLG